jgi:hypothetical protein
MSKRFIIGDHYNKNEPKMKVKPRKIQRMFVLIKHYRLNV